jgi:tetratricopeptide (TPR) repeat protein
MSEQRVAVRKLISIKNSSTRFRSASDPAQPVDYRSIGDSNRDAGRWAEAAAAYCQYLETNPGHAAIWIQAGNCFKETRNFTRSLTAYRQAAQLEPNNFDAHLQLGHLYNGAGKLFAALTAYEQAAALDSQSGEVKHEIRDVFERMKTTSNIGRHGGLNLHGSVEELLEALRNLPREEDPFTTYFHSIGGYMEDWRT